MSQEGREDHFFGEGIDVFQRLTLQPRGASQGAKRPKTSRGDQKSTADSNIYDALAFRRVPGEAISLCSFPENMLLRSVELPFERCYGEDFRKYPFRRTLDNYDPAFEYDLTDEDLAWVRIFNSRPNATVQIHPQEFAFLLDRLERCWDAVTRSWPSTRGGHYPPSDQSSQQWYACQVCGTQDTTPHNFLVLCEGCNLSVHQECYGVPLIPEGPWLCRICYEGAEDDVQCVLCSQSGGAMKPTVNPYGRWCHLVCARLLGTEAAILNDTYLEPIDLGSICKERWGLVCIFCRIKKGAPAQCDSRSCCRAMHAPCAEKAGYDIVIKGGKATIFCPLHGTIRRGAPREALLFRERSKLLLKPLIMPAFCRRAARNALLSAFPGSAVDLATVDQICRLWSIKRTRQNHGQALLEACRHSVKTSIVTSKTQGQRAEFLESLMKRLRGLETLSSLILERELEKRRRILMERDLLLISISPALTILSIMLSASKAESCIETLANVDGKKMEYLAQKFAERVGVKRLRYLPSDSICARSELERIKPLAILVDRSCTRLGISSLVDALKRPLLQKILEQFVKPA